MIEALYICACKLYHGIFSIKIIFENHAFSQKDDGPEKYHWGKVEHYVEAYYTHYTEKSFVVVELEYLYKDFGCHTLQLFGT